MYRTFHQEGEEQNDEEEVEKGLTMEQQFLQLVLQNVRHFISLSGQPAWQLAALGKHSVGINADPYSTLYLPISMQIRIRGAKSMRIRIPVRLCGH
jgi:hypothetical protein